MIMETLKDERLEQLSDRVRMGIPIDFIEALEVIEYQENLKKNKKKSFVRRAYRDWETDRKSTRLNSSHRSLSRMPSSA